MIVKMNNKDNKFYNYMGKQFGSRLLQRQIGDRMYDDDNKEWYIYLENEEVVGFISINNNSNVIKNVYAIEEKYLKELFNELNNDIVISPSVVTKLYVNEYKSLGFIVNEASSYRNFVIITSPKNNVKKRK